MDSHKSKSLKKNNSVEESFKEIDENKKNESQNDSSEFNRFLGPHGPNDSFSPPFRRPPPFFRGMRPLLGRAPPFGGRNSFFPHRKEDINEMRYFYLLNLLTEFPEGITAYQLQEQYRMPRSNVIRVLNDLLQKEFVITKDMIKDGRAQKLYSLTDKGQEKLRQMKTQWASFFTNMADQSPIEELANPFTIPEVRDTFLEELALCQTKEDAIDLLRGKRSEFNHLRAYIEERLKTMNNIKIQLDNLINFVEQQSEYSVDEIKNYLEKEEQ